MAKLEEVRRKILESFSGESSGWVFDTIDGAEIDRIMEKQALNGAKVAIAELALKSPELWIEDHGQTICVRLGPFMVRLPTIKEMEDLSNVENFKDIDYAIVELKDCLIYESDMFYDA